MSINLIIDPKKTVTWQQFLDHYPYNSIALDGFVDDRTQRDIQHKKANFDHHTGVDRLSTRCTAAQVCLEINLGLMDTFKNGPINVYINDCDEDTILSVWLLRNFTRVLNNGEPLLNKLVHVNDLLDCTGGVYPLGHLDILKTVNWIYAPYRKARSSGLVGMMNKEDMEMIVYDCMNRIDLYLAGKGEELDLSSGYKVLAEGKGWIFTEEESTAARMVLFSLGHNVLFSKLSNGRYVVTKKSMWIDFDLVDFYRFINEKEGASCWGGSNTIGGCLREHPSKLSVDQLKTYINEFLESKKV